MDESNIKLDIENTNEKVPKKRGRKPKIKTPEENQIANVPKKRGRKPKNDTIKEFKIPKKRGRKPNIFNTKTTIIPVNNDKTIKNDNILHLKVNTKDLDECLMDNDIYKYNPNLNEPEPYENVDNLYSNNFLTIKNKDDEIQIKPNLEKKENDEKKEIDENITEFDNQDYEDYNTQNTNYETNKKKKKYKTCNVLL